jgi:hypothetical protein
VQIADQSGQIAEAPAGFQAMTADVREFHRGVPVRPEHKRWLIVRGPDNTFWIDHCVPFGAASASSNAGMIGNAIADLLEAKGFGPVSKYKDDFTIGRLPIFGDGPESWTYRYGEAEVMEATASLRVLWKPEKQTNFAFEFPSIGFWWDCPKRRVSLTDAKRLKFLERVRMFLASFRGNQCALYDVQAIHGSLCHITFVYPAGRSRLPALSNFAAAFAKNPWGRRRPGSKVIEALQWWEATLAQPGVYRRLNPRTPAEDLGLYVDASTDWGIGIILGGKWDAWTLKEGWRAETRHNTWLEALAIELCIYALERRGLRDVRVLLNSDSQAAIGAFRKGRSPSPDMNLSIRRANVVLDALNVAVEFAYVKSEENPAGAVSRGVLGGTCDRLKGAELPAELLLYLEPT